MCKNGLTYSGAVGEKKELWALTDPRFFSQSLCTASVLVSNYKFFIMKPARCLICRP